MYTEMRNRKVYTLGEFLYTRFAPFCSRRAPTRSTARPSAFGGAQIMVLHSQESPKNCHWFGLLVSPEAILRCCSRWRMDQDGPELDLKRSRWVGSRDRVYIEESRWVVKCWPQTAHCLRTPMSLRPLVWRAGVARGHFEVLQ